MSREKIFVNAVVIRSYAKRGTKREMAISDNSTWGVLGVRGLGVGGLPRIAFHSLLSVWLFGCLASDWLELSGCEGQKAGLHFWRMRFNEFVMS